MKRTGIAAFGALLVFGGLATVHAQISTREQQAEQDALDARTPKLNYKEDVLQLLVPGYTMGETVGVDVNSQNHIFVYSRTNPQGIARGGTRRDAVGVRPEREVRQGVGAAQLRRLVRALGPRRPARQRLAGRRRLRDDRQVQSAGRAARAVRPHAGGDRLSRVDGREAGPRLRGRGAPARDGRSTCSTCCIPMAASARSTVRPTWPGIHTTTCSSPTATATRASSRSRLAATG